MPYNEKHLIEISLFKTLSEAVRAELDDLSDTSESLTTQLQTLEARYDVNVTASTDSDADYAAEVVDARVDTWANEHASLGANIRAVQQDLSDAIGGLNESQSSLANDNKCRKEEISNEVKERLESEFMVQLQLQALSEAILKQSVMLAETRNALREITKEE